MKKIDTKGIRRAVNMKVFKLKKSAPKLMVYGGAAGTVVSAVWACKQTLKLEGAIDEAKASIDAVRANTDDKKELTIAYAKGIGTVAKVYTGPIILETVSLGLIFGSNNIMCKRNAEAAAAYATLSSMYNKYLSSFSLLLIVCSPLASPSGKRGF